MMQKKWWHNTIGYQIYPRSFQDTNGDGNGDIPGITAHLDDLADLGINTIWLCPVNKSPMLDSGYDAADYDAVDPMFGTMEDMKQLIGAAKERGIRILMDLVVNHTSSEHRWFRQALADPDGEYGKYYIIREGHDGQPPNHWQSFFGGSAWEQIGDTNRYYLHLFTKWQPDLNWENPKLRREIYDMVNRWLDLGIAGFRIDSINHLKKDFRDEGREDFHACFTNVEGIGSFLQEMKEETYGARDAFTIGEVNGIRPDQLEEYIGEDGYFSTMFDFSCLRYRLQEPHWGGDRMQMMQGCKEEMFAAQRQAGGRALFCNVMENHDTPRIPERFFFPEQIGFHSLSMIASMNFFLGGIVFLYQGQSIGMRDYRKKSIDEFRDFATFNLYREYQKEGMTQEEALEKLNAGSREHARTPMQWNGNRNGGFSDAEPWFDVNPDYQNLNLEMQRQNPESLHSFYKNMIAVRKRGDLENLFIYGETVPAYEEEQRIAAYDRNYDGQKVRVLCNLVEESVELACDMPISEVLLTNYAEQELQGDTIRLEPFQVLVVKH